LDTVVAGGNASIAVAGTEDLKERDWVSNSCEEAIEFEGVAEGFPENSMFVGGSGTSRYDSGTDRVLDSAKVSAESMGGRNMHRPHGLLCG
jgi:hypothetical protein